MFRPSSFAPRVLATLAALVFVACTNPYREMYSPRRNHFKPVKEAPAAEAVLPVPGTTAPAAEGAGATPPAPPMDAPPPAIPGL